MKKLFFLILLIPQAAFAEAITLNYGANYIDINNDGLEDLIVKMRHENGNAHSYDTYVIAINTGHAYQTVPLGFPNEVKIQTVEGAGCVVETSNGISHLVDFEFNLTSDNNFEIKRYERPQGSGYGDIKPITITSYNLVDEVKEYGALTVGVPQFYMKEINREITEKEYCHVYEVLSSQP